MQTFWDQNFSAAGHKYGTEPNAFLAQQAHRFAAQGQVLVPGDGEGRNSVWLAQQGHSVTAMDSSTVGMAKARALAAALKRVKAVFLALAAPPVQRLTAGLYSTRALPHRAGRPSPSGF